MNWLYGRLLQYINNMFEDYHFSDDIKIISEKVPGEKSLELLDEQEKLESRNRSDHIQGNTNYF